MGHCLSRAYVYFCVESGQVDLIMANFQLTINKIATKIIVEHAFDTLTDEQKEKFIECQNKIKLLSAQYGEIGTIAVYLTGREFELEFLE